MGDENLNGCPEFSGTIKTVSECGGTIDGNGSTVEFCAGELTGLKAGDKYNYVEIEQTSPRGKKNKYRILTKRTP